MSKILREQEYKVHFDTRTPVSISVTVHHKDKTKLTKEEIITESLGYLEDLGIEMEENQIIEIKTLVLREIEGV